MDDAECAPERDVWADDFLGREAEAQAFTGFIESLYERPFIRERDQAYTIAVDANYGVGKSFFLTRLAKQLSARHPVAYVDAWSDDLADQPLIALLSTLKAALGPLTSNSAVAPKWDRFVAKSGKVASIAARGIAVRALGLLITAPAAAALEKAASAASEATQDAIQDAVTEGGGELATDIAAAFSGKSKRIEDQIKDFEDGRAAISELKTALREIVKTIDGTDRPGPIIIIIDELDRCKPSYAIKLLEEIKHLFDVFGIVFIFGINGDQLSHSMRGAYGSTFDGSAYLKRFINRRYVLNTPSMHNILEYLIEGYKLTSDQFVFPRNYTDGYSPEGTNLRKLLDLYVSITSTSARDVFELVDILDTCRALASPHKLILPYLIPRILSYMRQVPVEMIVDKFQASGSFLVGREGHQMTPKALYVAYGHLAELSDRELRRRVNQSEGGYIEDTVAESMFYGQGSNHHAAIANYANLVAAVASFKQM